MLMSKLIVLLNKSKEIKPKTTTSHENDKINKLQLTRMVLDFGSLEHFCCIFSGCRAC